MTAEFALLDVVTIRVSRHGESGKLGIVTEVRKYVEEGYRYELRQHEGNDIGGIYDEADLVATGSSVDIETLRDPGPFQPRELVEVSPEDGDGGTARRGHVTGLADIDLDGVAVYYVWLYDVEEIECISIGRLRKTGDRLSPDGPDSDISKVVDTHGNVVGTASYYTTDSITFHL